MPTFKISQGLNNAFDSLGKHFELIFLPGTITAESSTSAKFELEDTINVTITGTDFVFSGTGDDRTLVSGTLDSLVYNLFGPGYLITYSDLDFDIETLAEAASLEASEADTAAFEHLMFPLDWTLIGNSTYERIIENQQNVDGVTLDFSGNNDIWLNYGRDHFFAGDGKDKVRGGQLGDTLWGGRGNDKLLGQQGVDKLYGGNGADKLFGGFGNDILDGGKGPDRLVGGPDDDIFIGGEGKDVFIFNVSGWDTDTIVDFDPAEDRIHIRTWPDSISLTETDSGVEITWNSAYIHDTIEVLDITLDQLNSDNFHPWV